MGEVPLYGRTYAPNDHSRDKLELAKITRDVCIVKVNCDEGRQHAARQLWYHREFS